MIELLFDVALLGAVAPGLRLVPGRRFTGAGLRVAAGCAVALAIAMLLGPGAIAGALAVPWLLVAGAGAFARLPGLWARRRSIITVLDG